MKKSMVMCVVMLALPIVVFAECPSHMDVDQLVECITIEGSDANYQNWKKEHDSLVDSSAVSPITGEDIVTVAPAAGKSAK
ncbi:MAG: hypothetical protein OEY61_08540 [Gammaproteobacteria bacterium]|nr:hypothetical protein [Gammaproteobacteria bacterium]